MDKARAAERLTPASKPYGKLDVEMMKNARPWAPVSTNTRILVSARITNYIYNDANTQPACNALVVK